MTVPRLCAIVADAAAARTAVAGGADGVQIRLKDVATGERVALARALRDLAVTLIVNDDVDAAIAAGADGVHLGRSDPGAERALAAGLLLGRSAATLTEALEAEAGGADYVGAAPVWTTPTKPDAGAPLGVASLALICASVRIPVLAVGGVDAGNAGECIAAGAHGVAVVRAVREMEAVRRAVDAAWPETIGRRLTPAHARVHH